MRKSAKYVQCCSWLPTGPRLPGHRGLHRQRPRYRQLYRRMRRKQPLRKVCRNIFIRDDLDCTRTKKGISQRFSFNSKIT